MTRTPLRALARAAACAAAVALLAACGPDAAPAAEQPAAQPPAAQLAAAGPAPADPQAPAPGFVLEPQGQGRPARVVVHGVDLTGVGYDRGDPRAPIVMVEFSDFGCPYCARHALETLPTLDRDFVETGNVFYKHVPFVMGMFPNGDRAARAAECAGEQGEFWAMHDSVYAHQGEWKKGRQPDAVLGRLARTVVKDGAAWASCYAGDRTRGRTRAANETAGRLGVRATPTFFINGQMVEGALPLPVMRNGLNAMLRGDGPR